MRQRATNSRLLSGSLKSSSRYWSARFCFVSSFRFAPGMATVVLTGGSFTGSSRARLATVSLMLRLDGHGAAPAARSGPGPAAAATAPVARAAHEGVISLTACGPAARAHRGPPPGRGNS
eukprot:CAMPEP_0168496056 /NCGR_PEP_ID=MMETSP0228-20121227/72063_1 /TAXON_ID=133427 /ORGANISM="Protoceratium reticulatum, Strain CCCM 535 (=CCMP 1889)" /LENGTH=119 /DNA_ID=CAMNT_0008512909 /DNA_START=185 /DNA_END=540 /DNA_ORIENTATION=+